MSRKSLGSRCRVLNYSLSDKKVLFAAYRNSKQILLKKTQAAFDLQNVISQRIQNEELSHQTYDAVNESLGYNAVQYGASKINVL